MGKLDFLVKKQFRALFWRWVRKIKISSSSNR